MNQLPSPDDFISPFKTNYKRNLIVAPLGCTENSINTFQAQTTIKPGLLTNKIVPPEKIMNTEDEINSRNKSKSFYDGGRRKSQIQVSY